MTDTPTLTLLDELLELVATVESIRAAEADWQTKYDLIFSKRLCAHIRALFREVGVDFDRAPLRHAGTPRRGRHRGTSR